MDEIRIFAQYLCSVHICFIYSLDNLLDIFQEYLFYICMKFLVQRYFMPATFMSICFTFVFDIWFVLVFVLVFVWHFCKVFVLDTLYASLVCGGTCFTDETAKNRFQPRVKFIQSLFSPVLSFSSFDAMILIICFDYPDHPFWWSWISVLMVLITCFGGPEYPFYWSWSPV